MIRLALLVIAFMFALTPAYGGWLEDAVQGAAEGLGRRAVDEAADNAYEGAKEGARESVKKGKSRREDDDTAPSERLQGAVSPGNDSSETGRSGATADDIYSKYDFIPGDKVIFFDDFSDTDLGEFPRKWTLDGPKGDWNNAVEVIDYKGNRFLRSQPAKEAFGQNGATQYIRLNNKGDLPKKFTVEFDAMLGNGEENDSIQYFLLMTDGDNWPVSAIADTGSIQVTAEKGQSRNTETSISKNDNRVHHVAVSVNGTFVKAYVDNERVVNDPDAIARPVKRVGIYMGPYGGNRSERIMFTNFRLAEGGKDIKSALETDGKIVTHGILFDTGSDRIRPESLPTLKMILGILEGDPKLKFSIEGHTDNQGGKNVNQPLSEKRAKAVMAWLAGKGISAGRLTSKGWGDTKPLDKNSTPEGRANNRRVEFVRL